MQWPVLRDGLPMPVAADGDVVGHTPARIRTVHRAIRVLASL
jgi:diacylglycerol kinase family enzyme